MAEQNNPNRSILRVGGAIRVTEVFQVTPELMKDMQRSPCIGQCNASCDIPGAPSGAQVTAFYQKNV